MSKRASRLVIVSFQNKFHVELFGWIVRYYGANATSGLTVTLTDIRRMGEIRTVTTLRRKRDEISASMRLYEKQLAQARFGPSRISRRRSGYSTGSGKPSDIARYVDTYRLCQAWRAESGDMCAEALRQRGRADTRQLAPGTDEGEGRHGYRRYRARQGSD